MKSKYNPFKMWGSYVGAVIGAIWYPVYLFIFLSFFCTGSHCGDAGIAFVVTPLMALISAPIGFFLGWGIHSLWRKYK